MTTIQILLKHHKLLLQKYQKLMECPYYHNSHVDIMIRGKNYNMAKLSLGGLLHLWTGFKVYIKNQQVYLVSLRENDTILTGSGINKETGRLEIGQITIPGNENMSSLLLTNFHMPEPALYVPLKLMIIELQTGNQEYQKYLDELSNTFLPKLKQTMDNKIKLKQDQETFVITITIPLPIREIYSQQANEAEWKSLITLFRKNVNYSLSKLSFEKLNFNSNTCSIQRAFSHPNKLLGIDVYDEILIAMSIFEKIVAELLSSFIK